MNKKLEKEFKFCDKCKQCEEKVYIQYCKFCSAPDIFDGKTANEWITFSFDVCYEHTPVRKYIYVCVFRYGCFF